MTLREYIETDDIIISDFNGRVNEVIANMRSSFYAKDCTPTFWFDTYKSSKISQGLIDKLIVSFKKSQGRKCCMFKYNGETLQSILYISRNNPLAEFSTETYFDVIKQMTVFLLSEYKTVYESQIKLGALKCLFSLYKCWTNSGMSGTTEFTFDLDDAIKTIETLLDTECAELDIPQNVYIEMRKLHTEAVVKHIDVEGVGETLTKPKDVAHLTMLWEDGISQTEKVDRVIEYWHCSRSTAVRYMQKFGVWKQVKFNGVKPQSIVCVDADTGKKVKVYANGLTPEKLEKIAAIELEIKRLQQELKALKQGQTEQDDQSDAINILK